VFVSLRYRSSKLISVISLKLVAKFIRGTYSEVTTPVLKLNGISATKDDCGK